MENKLNQLEDKVNNHEKLFNNIDKTLDKLASNQEKMIHFEHELNLVKNELKHNVDIYTGKLKGIQELSDKEDTQIKQDIKDIKCDFKEIKVTLRNVMIGLIGSLGTAIAGIVLSQIGGK